jgi:hypothetical protein
MAIRAFDGRSPEALEDASGSKPGNDEITAAFAQKRAARAMGPVNTSADWQVRIRWSTRTRGAAWPEFTFDAKPTEVDASYCARSAMQWTDRTGSDLHVIDASVRAPGAADWAQVALSETCAR